MTVQAVRDHLNNKQKMVRKGTIYNTSTGLGRHLINLGVVVEYKEAPRVEKVEFVTKPERNLSSKPENLGWHELRGLAKELGVFSPKLNKDDLIKAINDSRK